MTSPLGTGATGPVRETWHEQAAFYSVVVLAALVQTVVYAARLVGTYRAIDLGVTPFELGLIASAYGAAAMTAAIPVGRLVDRYGEAPFVALSAVALSVGTVLALAGNSGWVLAGSSAAIGLGQLFYVVASQTLVGSRGDIRQRSSRYGLYAAGASFGQLVGPLVGAVVITAAGAGAGVPGIAVLVVMISAVLGVGVWLYRTDRHRPHGRHRTTSSERVPMVSLLRSPGMPLAMAASVALNLGVDTLVVFIPLYAETRGIPVEVVGALLALRAAASVAVRIFTGPVVGRLGPDRTLLLATFAAAVAIASVPLSGDTTVLTVLMLLIGAGLGLGTPMTLTWVAMAAPPASRGTAIALRVSGNRFGQMIAPSVLGAIAGPAGVAAAFLGLAGVLGVVGAVLLRTPLPRDGS